MKNVMILGISCLLLAILFSPTNSQDAAATGISRAFNPALSVNGLFAGMGSSTNQPLWNEIGLKTGLHYQEISLEMTSNVDVYLQSKVVFSTTEDEKVDVEEAYFTTLQMPIPVILRGGKMLNTFGRHNLYHLHHFAFAEAPMILNQVFGGDLCEVGLEASYLIPLNWYSDLTVGVLNGDNPYLFKSEKQGDLAYLFHLDNLWDVTEEISTRLGGSFLTGKKGLNNPSSFNEPVLLNIQNAFSQTWGVDFYLKWKPLKYGRYRSLVLQGEYVHTNISLDGQATGQLHGFFIQAMRQFNLTWWIQGRYEWFERSQELHNIFIEPYNLSYDRNQTLTGKRASVALAYVPTEFGAYRLQYNWTTLGEQTEHQIIFQINITMGSHPAHKY